MEEKISLDTKVWNKLPIKGDHLQAYQNKKYKTILYIDGKKKGPTGYKIS